MQHTLVAVFDNRSDAQQAQDDLVASGFARESVRLSEGDPTGQTGMSDTSLSSSASSTSTTTSTTGSDAGFGASIKNFFGDIFGSDRGEHAEMYSEAVTRGHYVLTLTADSEPEVERAADIVERYGPIDIDEQAEQWRGGTGLGSNAYQTGAGAQQQSQSASQQFTQSSGLGAAQGTVLGTAQGSDLGISQGSVQGTTLGQTQTGGDTLQGSQQRSDTTDTTAIPVIQEELKIGKRQVERGGVRIYQRVVETPVSESIGLREEHVQVQRRPVDKMVDPADINAFQETTIELRETAEEAVVAKSARVVEEVLVGKKVTQHEQQITDTVRHTEVEIEQLSSDDDSNFRNHFTSNYASAGGSYDQYEPAYRYGNSMARNDQYRGRQWNDVESNLRTDWETRNPGSTWETMKAAVRHGWERMTS